MPRDFNKLFEFLEAAQSAGDIDLFGGPDRVKEDTLNPEKI